MTAIAAQAGITKPILYRVFGDKGGLYRALAERHTTDLLERLRAALLAPGDLPQRAARTVRTYLALVEAAPSTYRFLMTGEAAAEPGVQGQLAAFLRRLGDLLAAGIRVELGLAADDPDPVAAVWAHGIVGMVQAAGDWWLDHPHEVSLDAVTEHLVGLLSGELPSRAASLRPAPTSMTRG